MKTSVWLAAASFAVLPPSVVSAADTPNPEGPGTLRIEVIAAGRDTGEPPTHLALEVVDIVTGHHYATVSTEEMLDPAGNPCPAVVGDVCSVDLALTVRALGSFLRVATETSTGGRQRAFSADCDGAAGVTGDAFGSVRLAIGETKTCRVTMVAPDEAIGTRPRTALLVRKSFDFDTHASGFSVGVVTLQSAAGPVASISVDNFHDLSDPTRSCPQIGAPPQCEWAVIFDDDELLKPLWIREAVEPIWLPIFGGDCDRGGGLPLVSLRGDLVVCTIHNVSLEDELTPDRNAVIRVEVVAPAEVLTSDHLPIGVQVVGTSSGKTVFAMVAPDGGQCEGLGTVVCSSDIGVAVDGSRGATTQRFWLNVPPGFTVSASGDCAGGTTSGGAAEVEIRIGELKTCRLTITLPPPLLHVANASVAEGSGGTTIISVPVTLSRPQSSVVTVAYTISNDTAVAPDDYASASGTLTFAPGQTLATIPLSVVGDIVGEANETFLVTLSSPVGATIADGHAVVTIVNDDDRTPPMIAVKKDVIVESKAAPVGVLYTSPTAADNADGPLPVTCLAKSGSAFPLGTTAITCSSKDRNGNVATATFNVVVRTPTTTGAVTNPGNDKPLTTVAPGRRVRVSAGGFAPGSTATLVWLGPAGEMIDIGVTTAAANGRIDAFVKVPKNAPLGIGQMTAVGADASGAEFVRAWRLEVVAD